MTRPVPTTVHPISLSLAHPRLPYILARLWFTDFQ
jgi:hypothetical protein